MALPFISNAQEEGDTTRSGPDTTALENGEDTLSQGNPGLSSNNTQKAALKDTVLMSFQKEKTDFSLDSMFINVLRVVNLKASPIRGDLELTRPDQWDLIGDHPEKVRVAPNDTFFIPIRMSIPQNAIGGGTYVLNAELDLETDQVHTSNSYITIPKRTQWNIDINEQTIYFNQYREFVTFDVKVRNDGNSLETIKLNYDIGERLIVDAFVNAPSVRFVELEPRSDTILTHSVRFKPVKNQKERFNQKGWNAKAISVKASTSREKKTESVWFRKLESQYEYSKQRRKYPLNIGMRALNFLNRGIPRVSLFSYGTVLFPRNRSLSHRINANNALELSPSRRAIQLEKLNRRTFFNIEYETPRYSVELGDRIRTGMLHYIYGTAARFEYRFDESNRVALFGKQNRFNATFGGGGQYHRKISNNYSLNGGVVYEDNAINNMRATSFQFGQTLTLQNAHSLHLDLIGSDMTFRKLSESVANPPTTDTTVFGFGYRARYRFRPDNDFSFSVSNRNMRNNPVNRTHRSYWRANGDYDLNETYDLRFNYNRNSRDLTRPPQQFFEENQFSRNQYGQLMLHMHKNPKQSYFIGPRFFETRRKRVHGLQDFNTDLINRRYLVQGGTRIRIDPLRYITPRIGAGFSNTYLRSQDTSEIRDFENLGNFVTNASLIYTGHHFQFNASYRRGPINLSTADFLREDGALSTTQEIVLMRPHYRREFKEGKYTLSGGLNYIYQLPSKLSNLNFRARGKGKFDKGWELSLAFNFSSNSRPTSRGGNFRSTRTTNFMFRVEKAFDIPQPRIEYHDLEIVFFEDQNGDGKRNEKEAPVANIMTSLERMNVDSAGPDVNFPFQELISSGDGTVTLKEIPEGSYDLRFEALENLNGLYFKEGSEQEMILKDNTTFYVPLVETYKIKGRIVVDRARYSSHDDLDLSRIRVIATDSNGNRVSTLTTKNGYYVLDIPGSGTYNVRVKNVLGKDFMPLKTRYQKIQFNGVKSINLNFKFKERSRRIQYSGDNDELDRLRDSLGIERGGQQPSRDRTDDQDQSSGTERTGAPGGNRGTTDTVDVGSAQDRDAGTEGQGGSAEEGGTVPTDSDGNTQEAEDESVPEEGRDTQNAGAGGTTEDQNDGSAEEGAGDQGTGTDSPPEEEADQEGDLDKDSYAVLDSLVGELLAQGIADQGQRQKVIEQAMKANQSSELAAAFEPDLSPDTMTDPMDSSRVGFLIDLGVNPDERSYQQVADLIDSDFTRVDTISGGRNRYTVGPYDSFESALQKQKELRDQGFEQTYMTGFYNNQRIRLEDALEAKGELGD